MLLDLIDLFLAEATHQVRIEVEIENRNALRPYQSCGFRATRVYGYYDLEL